MHVGHWTEDQWLRGEEYVAHPRWDGGGGDMIWSCGPVADRSLHDHAVRAPGDELGDAMMWRPLHRSDATGGTESPSDTRAAIFLNFGEPPRNGGVFVPFSCQKDKRRLRLLSVCNTLRGEALQFPRSRLPLTIKLLATNDKPLQLHSTNSQISLHFTMTLSGLHSNISLLIAFSSTSIAQANAPLTLRFSCLSTQGQRLSRIRRPHVIPIKKLYVHEDHGGS